MLDADTVVIGSGMGGLTAAVALARAGQKVLVLEQHYTPGGWTHSFALGGHRFSPGVHYLGQLQEGGALRRTFEGLGLGDSLGFFEVNPDGYDHVRAPEARFDFCRGEQPLIERLSAQFPAEARGIRTFIELSRRVRDELTELDRTSGFLQTMTLPYRTRHIGRFGLYSLQRILADRITDPALRGVLAIQCGDHGLPPSRAPFVLHATVAGHYLEGAWYPRGGGSAIAKALTKGLQRAGSSVQLETRVEKVLVEKGRAVGVRLAGGAEVRAANVVSNVDPSSTYLKLVGEELLPGGLKRKLARTKWSTAAVSLFFAVECDVRALGLDSGNYWLCRDLDAERAYQAMAEPDVLERDELPGLFLSITTLKDPSSYNGRQHICEAFVFVPYEAFARFAGQASGAHGPEYEALKKRITAKMLKTIEAQLPGLTRNVVFSDLGSPLTNVHYVEATGGSVYGTEKSWRQMGPLSFSQRSPIAGLTLCGASTLGHGLHGASLSGLNAAARILGCMPAELLKADQPRLKLWTDAEGLAWPQRSADARSVS